VGSFSVAGKDSKKGVIFKIDLKPQGQEKG